MNLALLGYGRLGHEIERLARATEPFAARRMDRSIRAALAGHRIDEFAG